jgi:multisubunit Na+/H+ antiporter MnhB subunit
MIVAALIAVQAKDMLASVIALGTLGLGLSQSFLFLQAPDLAIILLIIEILSLIALSRIAVEQKDTLSQEPKIMEKTGAIVFVILFLYAGFYAVKQLPAFGKPLLRLSQFYIKEGIERTGSANLVGAIALDFRLIDTIAGIAALLIIALGVRYLMQKHTENE